MYRKVKLALFISSISLLSACGGGGGTTTASPSPPAAYTVSVNASGLGANSVVLQNNGGDNLTISSDGVARFAGTLANAATYSVAVLTQADSQNCSVTNGTGTISSSNTTNITVLCKSQYAYVANGWGGTVSMYTVNNRTGILTSLNIQTVDIGAAAESITITPSGNYAYVTSPDINMISMFSINSSTGALTALSTARIETNLPLNMAINPAGTFAYVVGYNAISMYAINSTGILVALSTPRIAVNSPGKISISPNGAFAYVTSYANNTISMYSISSTTGILSALGTPAVAASSPSNITLNPSGTYAYVSSNSSNSVSLYSVDSNTGYINLASTPSISTNSPSAIAIDPAGKYAYIVNGFSVGGAVSMYSINNTTGVLTPLSMPTVSADVNAKEISINSAGTFAYVANYGSPFPAGSVGSVSMYSINRGTGILTALSPSTISAGLGPYSIALIK
jgi:6-phosphogluconolactonase (cycloisomerase 2 family)